MVDNSDELRRNKRKTIEMCVSVVVGSIIGAVRVSIIDSLSTLFSSIYHICLLINFSEIRHYRKTEMRERK